jgi:hypothetical protein
MSSFFTPRQVGGHLIGAVFLGHFHLQARQVVARTGVITHRAHEKPLEQVIHNVIERIKSRDVGHKASFQIRCN